MPNPVAHALPQPLGKLIPGASYATVSVRLDANLPALGPDGCDWTANQEIEVTASPDNAAPMYICVPLAGQAVNVQADLTNWTNVIAQIQPGDTWPRLSDYAYHWDLTKYYISAGNATDFAFGCVSR